MMSVISFLTSEENLDANYNTVLFGDVKSYLNKCFNGDGNILTELGFNNEIMTKFQALKDAELEFENLNNQFTDDKHAFVYKEYLSELVNKANFKSADLSLISLNTPDSDIKFTDLLADLNEYANSNNKKENWDITSTEENECQTDEPSELLIYHPNICYPSGKSWVDGFPDRQKLVDFQELLLLANSVDASKVKAIKNIINNLYSAYIDFLDEEIKTIVEYEKKIKLLTNIVKKYNGEEEQMFSFLNCKFIKTNIQVLLVNLKNCISNELYTIGIYLLMAAFSLAFGINFTLLLIVLLNMDLDKNKDKTKPLPTASGDDVPEMPMNSEGRVINVKQ